MGLWVMTRRSVTTPERSCSKDDRSKELSMLSPSSASSPWLEASGVLDGWVELL